MASHKKKLCKDLLNAEKKVILTDFQLISVKSLAFRNPQQIIAMAKTNRTNL
jgi:hypothetical protein